jgi:hypothetical protein
VMEEDRKVAKQFWKLSRHLSRLERILANKRGTGRRD